MIPYGRQSISTSDIDAVVEVLKSDFLTQGPVVPKFEKKIADYCGAQYAVAVSSATAALHLLCLSMGLGPGKRLWTSPITFVASANCALYCGAEVDFVDIDPISYNICPKSLEEKLEVASSLGKLPNILVAVHYAGQSCNMQSLFQLSKKYGFSIIEDASHAIGAEYKNKKVGCCEYSAATVFSFHPVKIMTTAEGGMVVTNNDQIARKVEMLRTHGITRNSMDFINRESKPGWYYEQITLGYNYRMTDLQAALGISQFDRIEEFLSNRLRIVSNYNKLLSVMDIRLPSISEDLRSAHHLYPIWVDRGFNFNDRDELYLKLRNDGIGVQVHYIPVHTQPYYRNMGFQWGDFPTAERFFSGTLSLPLYNDLTEVEQNNVIHSLKNAYGLA